MPKNRDLKAENDARGKQKRFKLTRVARWLVRIRLLQFLLLGSMLSYFIHRPLSPFAPRKPRDHRYQHLQAFTIHTSSSMASQDTRRPLPKFGEWDVSNPTSAEGYTIIFKRARDEKKTGYANMVTPRKSKPMYRHESYPHYPRKSKWFCCG